MGMLCKSAPEWSKKTRTTAIYK